MEKSEFRIRKLEGAKIFCLISQENMNFCHERVVKIEKKFQTFSGDNIVKFLQDRDILI